MIPKDMNQYMLRLWNDVNAESKNTKESNIPEEVFSRFYESLDEEHRKEADLVFSEWVLVSDAAMRFDALSIIDKYSITASRGNLIELSKRLSLSKLASDVYELKKTMRILGKL